MEINLGNTKGLVRAFGKEGRLCIPKEFIKSLNFKEKEEVEIFLLQDGVYIKRKDN